MIRSHPIAERLLEQVDFDLLFIHGNHEEHAYLQELRQEFASSMQTTVAVDVDWRGMSADRYAEG